MVQLELTAVRESVKEKNQEVEELRDLAVKHTQQLEAVKVEKGILESKLVNATKSRGFF